MIVKFTANKQKKKTVTEGEVIEYDVPQLEHRPRMVFFRREEKNANNMKQQEKINGQWLLEKSVQFLLGYASVLFMFKIILVAEQCKCIIFC